MQGRQSVGLERHPSPAGRHVPSAGRATRDGRFGGSIAAPVGGDAFDGEFIGCVYPVRYRASGIAELCRAESRREEHGEGAERRPEKQRRDAGEQKGPCEKPQGQCETVGGENPGRKRHDGFQHRHTVEFGKQEFGFHTCKYNKRGLFCVLFRQKVFMRTPDRAGLSAAIGEIAPNPAPRRPYRPPCRFPPAKWPPPCGASLVRSRVSTGRSSAMPTASATARM